MDRSDYNLAKELKDKVYTLQDSKRHLSTRSPEYKEIMKQQRKTATLLKQCNQRIRLEKKRQQLFELQEREGWYDAPVLGKTRRVTLNELMLRSLGTDREQVIRNVADIKQNIASIE